MDKDRRGPRAGGMNDQTREVREKRGGVWYYWRRDVKGVQSQRTRRGVERAMDPAQGKTRNQSADPGGKFGFQPSVKPFGPLDSPRLRLDHSLSRTLSRAQK